MKYISIYTTETENLKNDKVHPKPLIGGNSERQEGEGQGEGGGSDRDEEHDQSESEVEEKPQSQRERGQHQPEGLRVEEEVQEVIIIEKGKNPINRTMITMETHFSWY